MCNPNPYLFIHIDDAPRLFHNLIPIYSRIKKIKTSPVVVYQYEKYCFNDMTKYLYYTSAKYEQKRFYLCFLLQELLYSFAETTSKSIIIKNIDHQFHPIRNQTKGIIGTFSVWYESRNITFACLVKTINKNCTPHNFHISWITQCTMFYSQQLTLIGGTTTVAVRK